MTAYLGPLPVFSIILFLISLGALALAPVPFRMRERPGGLALGFLMLAVAVWSFTHGGEVAARTIPAKIIWAKFFYLGVTSGPLFLLAFSLEFGRQEKWLTWRHYAWLAVIPVITLILVWTNEWHQLIWTSYTPVPETLGLIYGHGPWFWVIVAYAYVVLILTVFFLARTAIRSRYLYRWQALLLLVAVFPTWAVNIMYVFNANPLPGLDLTPLGFALCGGTLVLAFKRLGFIDLVPIARKTVIDELQDGLLVLDGKGRILDINPVAARIFGVRIAHAVGRPVSAILASLPVLVDKLENTFTGAMELCIGFDRWLEIRVSALPNTGGLPAGKVILITDITERHQAQKKLRQAHTELEQRVQERTQALARSNQQLIQEIHDRKRAEDEVRVLNINLEQRVKERTRELAALYDASVAINRSSDVGAMAREVLSHFVQLLSCHSGAVFLVEDESNDAVSWLRLVAWHGHREKNWLELGTNLERRFLGKTGEESNEPTLFQDVSVEPGLSAFLPETACSLLVSPLISGNRQLGLLAIIGGRDISREHVALLVSIADQMAVAIERDRLRETSLQAAALRERERMARDLHDAITQSLYGLVTLTELGKAQLQAGQSRAIPNTLACIGEQARQSLKEMRLFIHQLRPSILADEGLVAALHNRLAAVEGRSDVQSRFLADETIHLATPVEENMYMIACEVLNNVLRHAGADSVTVYLGREKNQVILEIMDDGRGFDLQEVGSGGLGLTSMQERADEMGARLAISSIPGSGTRVRIVVEEQTL